MLKSSTKQNTRIYSKDSFVSLPYTYTKTHSARMNYVCNETFNITLKDNLDVIRNYPKGDAAVYLEQLGVNTIEPKELRTFPVFVTAFDSSHYNESQGLFKNLHENFLNNPKYTKDMLIIAYDMGLTETELAKVKANCKCEVRHLQFEHFPLHVRTLTTYAFKPIIVQEMLLEFGLVWWVDTSIRFTTNNIDPQIAFVQAHSMLYTVSRNFATKGTLTKNTLNATFDYLHEDRCKFRHFHEVWATTLLFNFDQITRAVVTAWVICALNKPCIAPIGSEGKRGCNLREDYDGRCHRFDQSAIGIITRRLYHDDDYPIDNNLTLIYSIKRDEIVQYFK